MPTERRRPIFLDRVQAQLETLTPERRRALMSAARAQSRLSAHGSAHRARAALWPVVQTACAAAIAWLVATRLFGHVTPFFAPVAAIVALGATRGQRARRAVELMLGVALGVGLGDLLIHLVGRGILQLAGVIALAMMAAVILGAGGFLLTEAAVSATLVVTIVPATGTYAPTRLIDALVGGAVALLFSQILFPVHPIRLVRRAAQSVLTELGHTVSDVAAALEERDLDAAEASLVRARRVNDDWARFEQALDVGREAARFSPRRRGLRSRFAAYRDVELPIGLMVTDVHVLARGAVRALTIGDSLPGRLVTALHDLARACGELAGHVNDDDHVEKTRDIALRAARVATEVEEHAGNLSASLLIGYTQATAADVLRALGMDREPAHAMVGQVAEAAQRRN